MKLLWKLLPYSIYSRVHGEGHRTRLEYVHIYIYICIKFYFTINIINFICRGWTWTSAGGKATPKENQSVKNQIGNSEVPGSLEESNSDYLSNKKR